MTAQWIGLAGAAAVLILMFLRVPIAIAMSTPAIVGIWYLRGWEPLTTVLNTIVWSHSYNYTLSTIPMFVLMSELIFVAGITSELFSVFQ